MSDTRTDPLLLGQRIVAILETGLHTATYKLATLMALIDHSIEHVPDEAGAKLVVPIPDLAHRVLELYWYQVRPFAGHELRQSTQGQARTGRRWPTTTPSITCCPGRCWGSMAWQT